MSALFLLLIADIVPGFVVESFYIALITAFVFGLVSLVIKPIITLLTLPIHLITFGLFAFVVNAFMLWFVASFIEGFDISSFKTALMGAVLLSLLTYAGNKLIDAINK